MGIDVAVRVGVSELLQAVAERPGHLPLAEIVALTASPYTVEIDRTGDATVVFVTPRPHACFDRLSRREREVAGLLATGLGNREIAARLHISVATVKDHVHAVLTRTGCPTRAAVAAAWHDAALGPETS